MPVHARSKTKSAVLIIIILSKLDASITFDTDFDSENHDPRAPGIKLLYLVLCFNI